MQLADHVAELQAQVASAKQEKEEVEHHVSDHGAQLEALQRLHAQCREEAEKLKAVLESKEEELSRMLTALQVASAQVRGEPVLNMLVQLQASIPPSGGHAV